MVAFWLDLCYNLGMQLGTLNEKGRMMDKDMIKDSDVQRIFDPAGVLK